MSTSSFCRPVPLPCFINGERKFDVWCDGCIIHEQTYDGFTNKVRITPTVKPPELIFSCVPVGEDYTIGVNHLTRIIIAENNKPFAL